MAVPSTWPRWPRGPGRAPNGVSATLPLGLFGGIGGTYYFNPGSPTAPKLTVTGGLGFGGGGLHSVFLRNGVTSQDTLGYGGTLNIAPTIVPSVIVNASVPEQNGIPLPWKARISSIEAGAGMSGFGSTYTATPRQIADFLTRYGLVSRGMGPQDELTPFERSLQSKNGGIGASVAPAVPFLDRQNRNPLGGGMDGWSASTPRPSALDTGAPPVRYLSRHPQASVGSVPGVMAGAAGPDLASPTPTGGLLGLIRDYMHNNPDGATR